MWFSVTGIQGAKDKSESGWEVDFQVSECFMGSK